MYKIGDHARRTVTVPHSSRPSSQAGYEFIIADVVENDVRDTNGRWHPMERIEKINAVARQPFQDGMYADGCIAYSQEGNEHYLTITSGPKTAEQIAEIAAFMAQLNEAINPQTHDELPYQGDE